MAQDDTPVYDVDDETRELLEACLNMIAQASSMQVTEEGAEGLIAIADALAERFQIDSHDIQIRDEKATNQDGEPQIITVYSSERKTRAKPKLRVIDGDKIDDSPPDDDDTRH